MINPFTFAANSKGANTALWRIMAILQRYGLTNKKMDQALTQFMHLLHQYNVNPTFTITGTTLMRNPTIAQRLHSNGAELAAHGWTHVSFTKLPVDQQTKYILATQEIFAKTNIPLTGFRSPYLSRNKSLPFILQDKNFNYVSNQPILWPVVDQSQYPVNKLASYQRALVFYNPWSPEERSPTPRILDSIVELPVSLPDDEMLLDRLGLSDEKIVGEAWTAILEQIYQQDGLFTLQLHPERIAQCANALSTVLQIAQNLTPSVWIARLTEVADWWRARTAAKVTVSACDDARWHFDVDGPQGTVLLIRGLTTDRCSCLWGDGYYLVEPPELLVQSPVRPFIGIPLNASSQLLDFLKQQGYIVEQSDSPKEYSLYLHQHNYDPSQEQHLLASIEESKQPLVKLGRWPNGARGAMAITGDIDALTVWDYFWRLFGR